MKRQAFDEALRERARCERFEVEADVDFALRGAMEHEKTAGKSVGEAMTRRRLRLLPAMAAALACVALGLALMQPPKDLLRGSAAPTEAPEDMEITMPLAQRKPKREPEVQAVLRASNDWACAEFTLSNDTEDIWLMDLTAAADGVALETADGLIWLEPGASCTARAAWMPGQAPGGFGETLPMSWSCTAYRVTADLLHWMDGEWLEPGQEGYEAQQGLIEDAFANGALILAPGDWKNGVAGPMRLAVPGRFYGEHPDVSELAYYLGQGMLEKSDTKMGAQLELSCFLDFVAADAPLAVKLCQGYIKRLMRMDIGPEYVHCMVDRVFETEKEAEEFWREGLSGFHGDTVMKGGGAISYDALRANELDVEGGNWGAVGVPWQDSAGRWHITNEALCYPVSGLKSGDTLTLKADGIADEEAFSYVVP